MHYENGFGLRKQNRTSLTVFNVTPFTPHLPHWQHGFLCVLAVDFVHICVALGTSVLINIILIITIILYIDHH